MKETPHVRIHRLDVHREGRSVLQGLDLEVDRGSFVAVEGRSGAGKTSLLACLAGLLEPTGGEISYRCQGGCDHTPTSFRSRLGCVFQHLLLTPNATVDTNVLCGLLGQRSAWRTIFGFAADDRRRALELLERLGIAQLAGKNVRVHHGANRERSPLLERRHALWPQRVRGRTARPSGASRAGHALDERRGVGKLPLCGASRKQHAPPPQRASGVALEHHRRVPPGREAGEPSKLARRLRTLHPLQCRGGGHLHRACMRDPRPVLLLQPRRSVVEHLVVQRLQRAQLCARRDGSRA